MSRTLSPRLVQRRWRAFELRANNYSAWDIAQMLGISERTVQVDLRWCQTHRDEQPISELGPFEITARDQQQIEVLAGLGLSLDRVALVLGISGSTLDRWLQADEVKMLYKNGVAKAETTIAKTLFEKAKDGDMTALIWYEKTRMGRSDRTEVKHTGSADSPVEIVLSPQQRKIRIAELQQRLGHSHGTA